MTINTKGLEKKLLELKSSIDSKSRIINKCKTEQEKSLAEYVFNAKDVHEAADMYASILYIILYDVDLEEIDILADYMDETIFYIYNVEDKNILLLNELLHCLHSRFADAREWAVGFVADARQELAGSQTILEITLSDYRIHREKFPVEIKNRVEQVLLPIRDSIHITYTATWMFAHIDMGDDYVYKDNEFSVLEIRLADEGLGDTVVSLLKKEFKNISVA